MQEFSQAFPERKKLCSVQFQLPASVLQPETRKMEEDYITTSMGRCVMNNPQNRVTVVMFL